MRQCEQLFPAMPGRQPLQCVGSQQQRERTRAVLVVQLLQRNDGVTGTAASDFAIVRHETRKFRTTKSSHGQTIRGGREGGRTMRRYARRNDVYPRQSKRLAYRAGEAEMAVVNRIESAAEDAEGRDHDAC